MKKPVNKALLILLAAILALGMAVYAGAIDIPIMERDLEGLMPEVQVINPDDYIMITGIVTEIFPSDRSADAPLVIMVEDENGARSMFTITSETHWASVITTIEVGNTVTGMIKANIPLPAIYPPNYPISIIAVHSNDFIIGAPPIVEKFIPIAGTVKEILPNDRSAFAEQRIVVELKDGGESIFIISPQYPRTLWASEATSVEPGDSVIGFVNANAPMTMIYPPQYFIEVMVVNLEEGLEVTVSRFDDELMSSDGVLQIGIGEHTRILNEEKEMFAGETIAGRLLVVFHDPIDEESTERTAAWTIIVMYERIVPLPIGIGDDSNIPLFLNGEIVVEGEIIKAPAPFVNDDGIVMVPLRAVAEALGFTVSWEEVTQSVMLNAVISLRIGYDYYTYARMAPIELGTAPELVNNFTYVPLNFFSIVARANNAYVFEGQVVVDNFEVME